MNLETRVHLAGKLDFATAFFGQQRHREARARPRGRGETRAPDGLGTISRNPAVSPP